MKNQKGFSLIELLVVVIIIAIIAAIAIPSLLASRRSANESAAVASLRTVNSAEQTYFALNSNDYGSYAELTGQSLVDSAWADNVVRGAHTYAAISLGANDDGFCATAVSSDAASKSYALSHRNSISYVAGGGGAPACDSGTGVLGGTIVK